jgi:hypothetical protein
MIYYADGISTCFCVIVDLKKKKEFAELCNSAFCWYCREGCIAVVSGICDWQRGILCYTLNTQGTTSALLRREAKQFELRWNDLCN